MATTLKPVSASSTRGLFGELLREWRMTRNLTQLDLALEAGVSQRHVSFLESGRSQPSRPMILQLAEALELPLRERNVLLDSAGFAALYEHRALAGSAMQPVRDALEMQLRHHEPYPALVVDRDWNLLMANTALHQLFSFLGDVQKVWAETNPDGGKNVMRLTMHPAGLRSYCQNWDELAPAMLQRVRRDAKLTGSPVLTQLLEELQADPDLRPHWNRPIVDIAPQPVYAMTLGAGDMSVSLFSMISTFGTPQDITTDELRIELFFPADDDSAERLRALSS